MTLKKWFKLFWQASLIGAIASFVTGIVLQVSGLNIEFKGTFDFVLYLVILLGYGMLVSVYSQLGFFAYLITNYMANGVLSRRVWEYVQLVLAAIALLEVMFFRTFVSANENVWSDIWLGVGLLIVAIIVAYYKVKMTNARAWIPTIFFMITVTVIEMIGGLQIGVDNATLFILIPLVACNAFQILVLHRITQRQEELN